MDSGADGGGFALLPRRVVARALDTGLALALSCVLVWPLAWGAVNEAAGPAGLGELLAAPTTDRDAVAGAVLSQLRPTVLGTVLLQAVVVWLYEALSTALTGVTPGKAAMRLRVVPDRVVTTGGPVPPPPAHPLLDRAVRMAVRALLVVGPPALAVLALTALALAVPGAVDAAELAIALALAVALLALRGRGLHGRLSGTRVVSFSWEQARQGARERVATAARGRARAAGEQAHRPPLDAYVQRLREAAAGVPRSQELQLRGRVDEAATRLSGTARERAGARSSRPPPRRGTAARRG